MFVPVSDAVGMGTCKFDLGTGMGQSAPHSRKKMKRLFVGKRKCDQSDMQDAGLYTEPDQT